MGAQVPAPSYQRSPVPFGTGQCLVKVEDLGPSSMRHKLDPIDEAPHQVQRGAVRQFTQEKLSALSGEPEPL